jgi:hypothetical protein
MSALLVLFLILAGTAFFSAVLVAGLRLIPMFRRDTKRFDAALSDELADEPLTARYRPMERLLRESEWDYLAAQPGFNPARIRAIKSERRKVFRGYLSCLSGDFAAVCLQIRVLMVQSPVARPDLAKALAKFRLQYAVALVKIEFRLLAHAVGIPSVRIDVSGLIRSLEQVGAQARSLTIKSAEPNFA